MPAWLAAQVGTEGRVLATDIDTRWLDGTLGRRGRAPRRRTRTDATSGRAVRPRARTPAAGARPRPRHRARRDGARRSRRRRLARRRGRRPGAAAAGLPREHQPRRGAGQPAQVGLPPAARRPRRRPRLRPHAPAPPAGAGLVDVAADAYFPDHRAGVRRTRARQRRAHPRPSSSTTASRPPREIDQHLAAVARRRLDLATSPMISAWGRATGDATPRARARGSARRYRSGSVSTSWRFGRRRPG